MELTAPVPNLPLLRKTLEYIEANPLEYNQDMYAVWSEESPCGAAFCVAGHALLLSGEYSYRGVFVHAATGEFVSAGRTALGLLGLTMSEGKTLFDASNTWADVLEAAGLIAARAGERL